MLSGVRCTLISIDDITQHTYSKVMIAITSNLHRGNRKIARQIHRRVGFEIRRNQVRGFSLG